MPNKNKKKQSNYSKDRKYLEEVAAQQANVPQEHLANDRRSWQRKFTDNLAGFIKNNPTSPSVVYPTISGFVEGSGVNPYTVGATVDALYASNPREEFLGEPQHHYDFTQSDEWADAHGYYPDARGHRDDRVKKPAHPSHPSRGTWNGDKFELTDFGMQNPNYTLFGLNDGGQDPQAIIMYKKGIVLPEITVTPKENYIFNPYDNIILHKKPLGGSLITNFKNKTRTRLNQVRAAQQTARELQKQTLANPITYIGGDEYESRRKFWANEPVLNHAVDSIAGRYNINPKLLKTRISEEGFVDNILKNRNKKFAEVGPYLPLNAANNRGYDLLNANIAGQWDDIGFNLFGTDCIGNMIDNGKVHTKGEAYGKYIPAVNEQGEYLDNTVSGKTVKDNFGVVAATLQYLRNKAKRDFPNASDADLDRYANAYYNKGEAGGRSWVRRGASGYSVNKYQNGGRFSLDEVRPQAKSGIHIKPENRGKFNATKKRTGKTTEELTHSKNPITRKRAIFAQNARKWHH